MVAYIALGAKVSEQFVSIVRVLLLPCSGSLSLLVA